MKEIITVLVLCLVVVLHAQPTELYVDASVHYQEIDNFGASDCWSMQKIGGWFPAQKNQVADLLFSVENGIGLSAWRFNIGAGINFATISHPWRTVETFETGEGEYDWSRQAEERWFLEAAKERGVEQFIAFVNSPPGRMTRNSFTNCTDLLGSTNLQNGNEAQFARYLVDILRHFRDEWNVEFDYISPVNEPQWEWNYGCNQEGNRAGNEDIKQMVAALYTELQAQQLNTEITLVESGNLENWYQQNQYMTSRYAQTYGNYLADLFNDPGTSTKISKIFSGHSYWSDRLETELTQERLALRANLISWLNSGYKYWMTEYCVLDGPEGAGGNGRDLTMKTALDVARVIHYDLTILNASAWQWWTAVSPEDYKDGLIYTDYMTSPSVQSIIESKTLWALGNYSRFIRPGSVRISMLGANNKYGLMGSAYLNADMNQMIMVFVNVAETGMPVQLNLSGLVDGKEIAEFIPYVTSDSAGQNLQVQDPVPHDVPYVVPARSVVTLIGNITSVGQLHDSSQSTAPRLFNLHQNYPNPFNQKTRIRYDLYQPAVVEMEIYAPDGRLVKSYAKLALEPGEHELEWDGTNHYGAMVSSGVYLFAMQSNEVREVHKMVLLR
jgi:hypothetical protein